MKDRFIKIVFDMKSFSMEMVLDARIIFLGRPLILAEKSRTRSQVMAIGPAVPL